MTMYEVVYMDNGGEQFMDTQDASSHREAAQRSVNSEDRISSSDYTDFRLRVYPAGDPEDSEFFDYVDFI